MKGDQNQIKKAVEKVGAEVNKDSGTIKEAAKDVMQKAYLPKDLLGLSDQMVEGIYGQAYRLYQTGRYNDASQLFRLLIMINSTDPKFTLGLGACLHMLKDYKAAAGVYALCAVIDPDNPLPHYHASDCFLQMNDKPSALISLELAIKRAGEKPEYQKLKDRALLTVENLKKEIEKRAARQ